MDIQEQYQSRTREMSGDDGESSKKAGSQPSLHPQLPPVSPYSRILANHHGNQQMGSQNLRTSNFERPSLARSLSQPLSLALDSLYHASNEQMGTESSYSLLPLSPFAPSGSCFGIGASFQTHRRSNSDVPFRLPGTSLPWKIPGALDMPVLVQEVKRDPICARKSDDNNTEMMGEGKSEMVNIDEDVFSTYMSLDHIDASNPSGAVGKCGNEVQEALDSQDKVNGGDGCENEETISVDEIGRFTFKRPGVMSSLPDMSEGVKRVAVADVSQMNRHFRSVSADSFMENTNLDDELLEIPPYLGTLPGQLLSPMSSTESNSNAISLVLGSVAFTGADLNKIMTNEKLTEIALKDPRRAKRILSNRKSAARSKERKMRYVAELEHRILTLQNETAILAAQLAQLECDSVALTSQNNELKLRLQALEQQAHLQEALKGALTEELQRLKLANDSSSMIHQCSIDPWMLHLFKKQETDQPNMHQTQPQKQRTESQQLNDEVITSAEHESMQSSDI